MKQAIFNHEVCKLLTGTIYSLQALPISSCFDQQMLLQAKGKDFTVACVFVLVKEYMCTYVSEYMRSCV